MLVDRALQETSTHDSSTSAIAAPIIAASNATTTSTTSIVKNLFSRSHSPEKTAKKLERSTSPHKKTSNIFEKFLIYKPSLFKQDCEFRLADKTLVYNCVVRKDFAFVNVSIIKNGRHQYKVSRKLWESNMSVTSVLDGTNMEFVCRDDHNIAEKRTFEYNGETLAWKQKLLSSDWTLVHYTTNEKITIAEFHSCKMYPHKVGTLEVREEGKDLVDVIATTLFAILEQRRNDRSISNSNQYSLHGDD